jgi:hypothetical protein
MAQERLIKDQFWILMLLLGTVKVWFDFGAPIFPSFNSFLISYL